MAVQYKKESCEDFITLLASKAPVPGGGGASALAGALGAALGNMTGSLTTGKERYRDVEEDIQQMNREARQLQTELLDLVQQDAEAFAPLAAAYGLPKETPQQRKEKEQILEQALRGACRVPFAVMEKCCRAIELCGAFAEKGSRLAVSDAAAGACLCRAALQSASLNIYINTKAMQDREYARQANERADRMLAEYLPAADRIAEGVLTSLR